MRLTPHGAREIEETPPPAPPYPGKGQGPAAQAWETLDTGLRRYDGEKRGASSYLCLSIPTISLVQPALTAAQQIRSVAASVSGGCGWRNASRGCVATRLWTAGPRYY